MPVLGFMFDYPRDSQNIGCCLKHHALQTTKEHWEQADSLPQGGAHQIGYPVSNGQSWKHTSFIIQTEQVVFIYLEYM